MKELLTFLKGLEPLEKVPDEQLIWLIDHSEVRTIEKQEDAFSPGESADHLFIVLEGKLNIKLQREGGVRQLGELVAGDISGVLPYSRMTTTAARATAITAAKALALHRSLFQEMIKENFELTQAFVQVMTTRIRNFTTLQIQNEKLMSLGKLSAGLAHELNNPASAIVRSSQALREHLKSQPESFKKVMGIKMTDEKVDFVNDLLFSKMANSTAPELTLVERNDLEDDLTDWLEDHGASNAFEIVENLVEFGFDINDLELIKEKTGEESLLPVVKWIDDNLSTEKLVDEISEASERIAELIKSIKSYSYMDQTNDRQEVNIHEGLRNTITMLKHKVKKGQIILIEDFAKDLPTIKGFPGELNQVWTNILDNAIDALAENPSQNNATITLRTIHDGDFLKVYIIDNGPGIPTNVINNIFDPFYTTKDMGKGTGLGLDVVMKIIRQHRGEVKVKSEPGSTTFEVCVPIN